MNETSRMDRRQFARGMVGGAGCLTAGLAAIAASAAEDSPRVKVPEENPAAKSKEEKPAVEAGQPELPPEVLLLTYLIRQYPNEHFEKDAIAGIFRDIRGDVARGQLLQDFPLKNSDEPAFVFKAYR